MLFPRNEPVLEGRHTCRRVSWVKRGKRDRTEEGRSGRQEHRKGRRRDKTFPYPHPQSPSPKSGVRAEMTVIGTLDHGRRVGETSKEQVLFTPPTMSAFRLPTTETPSLLLCTLSRVDHCRGRIATEETPSVASTTYEEQSESVVRLIQPQVQPQGSGGSTSPK